MKFISLFSGIGGFDKGFENAGMECSSQVEIDTYATEVLEKHWPDVRRYKDVRDVGRKEFGAVDLICGGFPCQDLSVAGKRAGLDGERSGLWFEFARIIQELEPAWVVIENVPGLYSSDKGRDFEIILRTLDEWGYGVAWRRLDSQYYGLAQRRKRVFIVGHLGDISAGKVLFEQESLSGDTAPSREKREGNASISGTLAANRGGLDRPAGNANELDFCIPEISGTLTARAGKDGASSNAQFNKLIPEVSNTPQIKRRDGIGPDHETLIPDIAGSITTREGQRMKLDQDTYIIDARQDPVHDKNLSLPIGAKDRGHAVVFQQNTRDEVRELGNNIAGALSARAGMKQKNYISQKMGVRRLTPLECEKLQGFDAGWTEGHSDTQRYKMLGNAVSVPVAEWIGKRIMQYENL